ncbi:CvpA family protein [Erysipelothrix sp. HDW6C]|uniref:CvpA family protein n=1 Tax=Erysipelothrix sp. HDW6C TaxID=2714930 RepID=UPI00140C2F24|nr:CvpA family protein [Erysipelothrix sp. HDW6C]QIK69881.1 CvpA family protein [Erysipelothrix sp. HDW6C]
MFKFPVEWMLYVNIIIALWFLVDLYRGYKRGLLLQLVDIVGTFVSLFAAWILSPIFVKVYAFVQIEGNGFISINQLVGHQINRLIWFAILFVVIRVALLIVTPLASFVSKMPLIKQVNSAVGGVFSVVFFLVKMMLVIVFLSTPVVKNGQEIVENSWLKHVDSFTRPIMATVDDFMIRNEAIQTIILEQKLPKEQEKALTEWLFKNGFTEKEIKEFLNKYE